MKERFDFSGVMRRASTWLSGISAGSLIAFAALPEEIKRVFPDWTLLALGVTAVVLVPVATSFQQRRGGQK